MTPSSPVSNVGSGQADSAQSRLHPARLPGVSRNLSLRMRRASLYQDQEEMLDILGRNFGADQSLHFNWRHIDNPAGEAWVWFAFDQHGKTVATVSAFPRRMFVNGKAVLCGQVGGFAVDAEYRSLGPAVLLQRTTFEPVDSGAFAFCYDCPPHDQGMSTFVRLGMHPNCEVDRYALLLRCDEFMEKRLGKGAWVKPLVASANLFVGRRSAPRVLSGLEVTELSGPFGDEFSHLDKRVTSLGTLRACRSAELLNWRYWNYPEKVYRILVARQAGQLLGFLTAWMCAGRAQIMDLFGCQLTTVGPALLEGAINICKQAKMHSVHGFSSGDNELKAVFAAVGFRKRNIDCRVVAYEKAGSDKILTRGLRWSFGRPEQMV